MIVIWKKNGLKLRVLGTFVGKLGEARLLVQKETATGSHGIFSVHYKDVA